MADAIDNGFASDDWKAGDMSIRESLISDELAYAKQHHAPYKPGDNEKSLREDVDYVNQLPLERRTAILDGLRERESGHYKIAEGLMADHKPIHTLVQISPDGYLIVPPLSTK